MVRFFVAIVLCLTAASAFGQTHASAQQDAEQMARTGVLRHLGRAGGQREGIGFSTASPEAAKRNCCYFGRYRIADCGVAYSPQRRGWFAVIRYGN